MASVRVAVRVRPMNKREKQLSSEVIVQIKGKTTSIHKPLTSQGNDQKDERKIFTFDFSYDSTDRTSPTFTSQEKIYSDLGYDVLKAASEGFNACVFAYGQTGSGKSYTMMGNPEDRGLIPRICEGLFLQISQRSQNDDVSFHTEVSYLEIYNERVQDLLQKRSAATDGGGLRVREHPKDGPYVENLSKHVVNNHSDMENLIHVGNTNRTTAGTGMNDYSSRSHAIFTINFTQTQFDLELPRETLSKIHLVDLAGCERANATCATGIRLKEGANINKSLVTLGTVISALADLSGGGQSTKRKKQIFVPYRDSVLTWLLKDSLGGNSVTTMIATVSPADVNYGETLSTLRYASRAKNIINSPTVNEDGSAKLIRELQEELTRLRMLLEAANQVPRRELSPSVKVEEELNQNEEKVLTPTREWTGKWSETQRILQEETVALRKEGSGVALDCMLPHLICIDKDLLSARIILYYLKEGRTLIGSETASCSQGIVLHGPGLLSEHCVLENCAGTVTLIPQDGALCSVNGSAVTDPCQLTQGAIIELGRGTILRFNHPTEAAQLREKPQSELLSPVTPFLTDMSTSFENQTPGRVEEKLNQQEVEWKQVQESLNRRSRDFKRLSKESSGAPHQQRAEQKTTGAEIEDPGTGLSAQTAESEVSNSRVTSVTAEQLMTTAIPGKYPAPHISLEVDGNSLQGGVSTREGQKQERDSSHKSGPGLVSERLWREAQSVAGDAGYKREEVWSGDASLQQTSVLGPGDGCSVKPEGNANEIQGVVADGYKGRPGSGGSSLGIVSHLQRGRSSSTSVLPRTDAHSPLSKKPLSSHAARCPHEKSTIKGWPGCREMDESGGLDEFPGFDVTETAAVQKSRLGSLVSRVSWIVKDVGRLLWSSPSVLQQVRKERLLPVGASLSRQVMSLFKQSNALSLVKESQVFSMGKGSIVFSLLKESHFLSVLKELPLINHIQLEITQSLLSENADWMSPEPTKLPILTPVQSCSKAGELKNAKPLIGKDTGDLRLPKEQHLADIYAKQDNEQVKKQVTREAGMKHAPEDDDQDMEDSWTVHKTKDFQIFTQTLITFPDSLSNLQTQPLENMLHSLQPIIANSVLISQNILALFWLNVATCNQHKPRPALLILFETGFYTLTDDSGLLVLFHYLPLLQLQEMHIGFAGHSLRLRGATKDSILGVYTYSQIITKELCKAVLNIIRPEDDRVSLHPLLCGDLMQMSVRWQDFAPDLLLDAGLKVCSQFQRSLADLVYLLHCNMDEEKVALGDVRLLLYTSVGFYSSSIPKSQSLAHFLLTDTHLGLLQEDAVFHPLPRSISVASCHPQFHDLTLRQRSDVRCVLMHGEDNHGAVILDVILANVWARGHPESVTEAATLPEPASHSSPHAEVWKLTFSCSSEAACLINHLSNV
ncbi:uncharacterized protein kif16bb [Cheilinus undulatus]|uniref:uncharacterized protein kif16bb n=1 Tax=Cheilinus undulatus TaxID=241271 RepID=UPI001BD4CB13|nr:uncharacterized protein kif16bb [Cheilinus undulatus]